jgi:hypothetical protein
VDSEEVIASVAGTVERVNKLVTVRAIRSRSGKISGFNNHGLNGFTPGTIPRLAISSSGA